MKRIEDFYVSVLGFKVTSRHKDDQGNPRSVWLDLNGTILMLEKTDAVPLTGTEVKSGWHLAAFEIPPPERAAWKDLLQLKGIALEETSPYSLYFRDPENNRIALSHYPHRSE